MKRRKRRAPSHRTPHACFMSARRQRVRLKLSVRSADASSACWEWHQIRADEASALLTTSRLTGSFNRTRRQLCRGPSGPTPPLRCAVGETSTLLKTLVADEPPPLAVEAKLTR